MSAAELTRESDEDSDDADRHTRTTGGFPCPICTNPHKGKVNLRQHLPICVEKNGLTGEQRHKLLKIKLKECRHCKRWFSPSTIPSHERKCEAEHRTNDQPDYNQHERKGYTKN